MELSELNERLALTFEPKPKPRQTVMLDTSEYSKTMAWVFHNTGFADGDKDVVSPADFTSDYWFKRLVTEHRMSLGWDGIRWHAYLGEHVAVAASPERAVALCALKVREEAK